MPITVPSSSFEFSSDKDVILDEAEGSSGGVHNEINPIKGLYLSTIAWDPRMPDMPYKPRWKIVKSTRLIYLNVVSHWVVHAFPPAEVSYVEGQDCGQLLDSTLIDVVSDVKRIAEIKRRCSQDNCELYQTHQVVQQMMDELQRQDSLIDAAKVRESRLLAEKQKTEEDLRRVTSNLAEEHVIWARDCQEKGRLISHALKTQKELERKVVTEAEKVRVPSSKIASLCIDHEFISQVQERHTALIAEMEDTQAKFNQATQRCDELIVQWSRLQRDLDAEKSRRAESENAVNQALAEASELRAQLGVLKGEKTWWASHGVVSCFEFLRRSPHFSGVTFVFFKHCTTLNNSIINEKLCFYSKICLFMYDICTFLILVQFRALKHFLESYT
ncbi:hypothetical protein HanRHA438_Chr05g0216071 [Helianthus annuus]|uniref:Uncharacterized protein n=1 Tax=Helianthus annuus TaxID=4232 RepID=A0A9K3NLQ4_HELAN|nr:hypothetical protein HanXRQr2_Chr05g0206441 [Helianthus annuus]KAJ0569705.1 hypothetical protein HanHA300_Chr05g0169441 [Helianthus annuus]KAJ0584023.1 hypothetical protein HanHA89_Chr05g0183571 [Helianthus annuus]KAJ0918286.1 hypothetical protein HanRHA438_Chr05g0216071 [Helianthus annuus]KAJ0922079.1 hypothetical protein HanPSC8_Chr05g0199351 [Helianthus annuus]